MKTIILLALTALMMVGCDYKNPDGSYDTSRCVNLRSIVIDSCEYIARRNTYGNGYNQLAHKGNCKYCNERRQKELEELVEQINEK